MWTKSISIRDWTSPGLRCSKLLAKSWIFFQFFQRFWNCKQQLNWAYSVKSWNWARPPCSTQQSQSAPSTKQQRKRSFFNKLQIRFEFKLPTVNNIKEGKSSKIRIVACYRTSQQIFYMNLVWKSKSHKSLTNGEKSMKLCLHLSSKYTRNPFFSFEVKK